MNLSLNSRLATARAMNVLVMAAALPSQNQIPRIAQLVRDNVERKPQIRAETKDGEAHVYVYGIIGGYWGDVSAQSFASQIAALQASTVHLHVNSPGGDVFDARAMMAAIANHPATFVAHVDGLAASAASDLIMACDEIEISQGGFLMIHNAWTIVIGNKEDMRETAALLDKVDEALVDDYRKKTKKSAEQVKQWMAAETWFTAQEAKDNGFVDRIVELVPEKEEGESTEGHWNLAAYEHAPAALKAAKPAKPTKPAHDAAAHHANLSRRLQLLERTAA